MYENVDKQNRLWKFEPAAVEEGATAKYYIKNVATEQYFGNDANLVNDQSKAHPYAITQLKGSIVALDGGVNKDGNVDGSKRIHANGHGGGNGTTGNIVYWNAGVGSSSAWTICESNYYITDLDFTEMEGTDEYVAPAVKGIFDLFGRRIEAPAATGLYIVDGKKRVIKK